MSAAETCAFHDSWDPATGEPTGPECGKPATATIRWRDGRESPSCVMHGFKSLTREAKALVAYVVDIGVIELKEEKR